MMQLAARIAAVVAVAAVATGCATASSSSPAAASGGGATVGRASSPASASATPVPTTTTGPPIVPGRPLCAGWPANATRSRTLPASFVPVAAVRCVNDFQMIPGKGRWEVATLERADGHLAPLLTALRRPNQTRPAGMFCTEMVARPPEVALVSGDGTAIWPALPVTGCGQVQAQVIGALAALPWQKVSVRLVARV